MPNTTNFNWPTPADTDLVKDGAAAIRNLGNGIDTSLIDLKGGTTGQILSKASNADMDFTFITPNVGDITEVQAGVGISIASGTGPIPVITNSSTDLITTAGDILYGTAADTMARLGIGTAGQVLKVNSGATAPEWGAAPSYTWTSYTTTYTNLTIGNGTTVSEYLEIGDLVFVRFLLTFGSTSSISGNVSFNLPVTASTTISDADIGGGLMGNAMLYDNSLVKPINGTPFQLSSTLWRISPDIETGSYVNGGGVINASTPFTWATDDLAQATFWYRKA